MRKIILLSFSCIMPLSASMRTEWEYSKAIRCAQDEQWADAQQRMSSLMIDDPDNAELLYDSGVAAYRIKEYCKAAAYFQQATENKQASDALKEKAYFNLGNSKVALNELQGAVDPYESALAIDPEDERAAYNLKKVRELLEQQKQQENQQQKQNQDKQDTKEQEQKNNQSQQQQQSADGDQSEQKGNEQKGQRGNEEQQQQSSEDAQNESAGKERDEQCADQQEKGKREDQANDKSNGENGDQQQEQCGDTHDSSPQNNSEQDEQAQARDADLHHTKEGDESQGMQTGELDEQEGIEHMLAQQQKDLEQELAPEDRWMARVLQQRERADEKANKRIVKTTIDKELVGKDGQNCW